MGFLMCIWDEGFDDDGEGFSREVFCGVFGMFVVYGMIEGGEDFSREVFCGVFGVEFLWFLFCVSFLSVMHGLHRCVVESF